MFDFDPEKSESNLAKHGINFETAQQLWQDGQAITGNSGFPQEARQLLIGKLDDKHWTAVFTKRDDIIRIISVRRSRIKEAFAYDSQKD